MSLTTSAISIQLYVAGSTGVICVTSVNVVRSVVCVIVVPGGRGMTDAATVFLEIDFSRACRDGV